MKKQRKQILLVLMLLISLMLQLYSPVLAGDSDTSSIDTEEIITEEDSLASPVEDALPNAGITITDDNPEQENPTSPEDVSMPTETGENSLTETPQENTDVDGEVGDLNTQGSGSALPSARGAYIGKGSSEEPGENVEANAKNEPLQRSSGLNGDTKNSGLDGDTRGSGLDGDTDAYTSSINYAEGQAEAFYGGEIITIYNNVSVSGNQTELGEGSYTVVSLPKASFQKPKESDVSTNFDLFKSLEIKETEDAYQVITTYKSIYGGYVGGTPIRVNLLPSQTVNLSEHPITQEFYNAAGEKLTPTSNLIVKGKAKIEWLGSSNYSQVRLKNEVDENYVIKPGTEFSFLVPSYFPGNNTNDPRSRRIYAEIPEGTTVKEGTGWTFDSESGKYYKDITRRFSDSWPYRVSITLDLGGIDLSSFNSKYNYKSLRVNFSIQPVVDGVPQADLGPYTGYCSRSYYILEQEPPTPPSSEQSASVSWGTSKYNKPINQAYESLAGTSTQWSNTTCISYNPEDLNNQRIRYTHRNVSSWYISYGKDDTDSRELIIKTSRITPSRYTQPSEIRIMLLGLSGDDLTYMQEKLQGTKAYGVASDGTITLLSDNVPIVSYASYSSSFDNQGWQAFTGGENYRYILFEYPNGGVALKGQTEINKFKSVLWTEVIADIKLSTYNTLKNLLDSNKTPEVYTTYDYATTAITSKYKRYYAGDVISTNSSKSDYTNDYFRMQYETITLCNNVHVTNGSQFFAGDIIDTRLGYYHRRYGNFCEANIPENANIYYLVPDGLEPVEDPTKFKSVEVLRGYRPDYNLVIAQPETTDIPSLDGSIYRSTQNRYELSFTATERLQVGTYTIYSCLSIDNNKIAVKDGKQYGILQFDTPSGVWSNILKDAANRPDDNTKYTNMGSTSFKIYPPKVLSSIKYVKLSSDPDTRYASSLGRKATIGDAIDYRWMLKNNSGREIDRLIILDILPYDGDIAIVPCQSGEYKPRGSAFRTPLVSIDPHEKFDFYYTTDPVKPTTQENYSANWVTTVDDMSRVTMIKAVLKDNQKIDVNEEVHIHTHNFIEDDNTILDGEKAYNSFALSMNDGLSFVEALKVEVQVTYPKRDVRLEKSDVNDPNRKLHNAVFTVYEVGGAGDGSDLIVLDDVKTNIDGIAYFPNLLVGKEYYLIEKAAPEGYAKFEEKIYFTIEPETEENTGPQDLKVTNDIPRVDVSGNKIWEDNDDQDGKRPASITINLYKKVGEADEFVDDTTVAPDEKGIWAWSFTGLPKYDSDKNEINYFFKESEIGFGYEATITGDMTTGYTVTNKKTPETITIEGTKTWDDAENQDGNRPESITIRIWNGDTEIDSVVVTEDDGWAWIFENLPKYENGVLITYTITEDSIENYSSEISGYNVTNTHTPGKTTVQVTKAWVDENNQDGMRPEFVTIKLLADGVDTEKRVTLSADNNWTDTFTELDIFKPGEVGQRVVYTVEEADVDGYTAEISGDAETGYFVTNCHTPEKITIEGTKTWDDNDDQDGKRPESIIIRIWNGATEIDWVEVTADANGDWTWTFADLPKYEGGEEIVYSISEDAVAGYTSEVSGHNVTNRHATVKISIPVTKVWAVLNDPSGEHPDSVTIKLIADGEDTGKILVLTNDNEWTDTFIELDQYKDGKEIVYTIDEILIEDYDCIITGDVENGFVVINSQVKSMNILPKTGERVGIQPWMSFALLSLACVLLVLRKKRSSVLEEESQKNTEA